LLFGELLLFTENELDEIGFKLSLLYAKDVSIRKEMILSKLSELIKKEPLQLTSLYVTVFRSDTILTKLFLDIKKNLGDVQVRYGRHLNPKITESLIITQDLLELWNMSYEMDLRWNKPQGQSLIDLANKLMSSQQQDQKLSSIALIENVLPTYVKRLLQEIYELWKMGIEFDRA
jgi:hypothetical protein